MIGIEDVLLRAMALVQDHLLIHNDRVYVSTKIYPDGSGAVKMWIPGCGPPPRGDEDVFKFHDLGELRAWAESVISDPQAALGSTVPPA